MNYYRNIKGQFARKWFNLSTYRKVIAIAFLINLSVIPTYKAAQFLSPVELHAFNTAEAAEIQGLKGDRLDQKIAELKGELLDTLAKCESGGRSSESGIIVWDTNNKPSLGEYQFQVATVQHYVSILWKEKITGRDAILIALDPEKSRQLASDIIFTTKNGVAKDWVICSRNNGLQTKVDFINSLGN